MNLGDPTLSGALPKYTAADVAIKKALESNRYDGYGPSVGMLFSIFIFSLLHHAYKLDALSVISIKLSHYTTLILSVFLLTTICTAIIL